MTLLHAVLLGVIQGVAEFLPISSSGHLAIAEHLLGQAGAADIPGFFDVLLHLGTLAAVFAAYWRDIREMIAEFFSGVGDLVHGTTPTPVPPARRLILLIIGYFRLRLHYAVWLNSVILCVINCAADTCQ